MAKQTTPLSPTLLDSLRNKDKLVRMYDGNGLILEIRALPSKKKVWRFKYSHPISKKDILLTLGEYPALSLKNARAKRSEYLALLAEKLDPREQLQIEQDKLDNATSLEKVPRLWHTEQTAKGKWGGDTGHKTLRKFENHLFPLIGELPIEEIRTHDLTKALTIIDNKGVNRVARDLRANLVRIFTFAIQHDYIRHNPARELDGLITARKIKHHPALPHDRLNEMSHKERDKTRLAYTHMAEFLEERKEMMYWWGNYLERNKKGYISPHDYGVLTKLELDQSEIIQFKKA